ncbi:MAG: hypothetical protein EXR98_24395 [Gemmataceae bacterium]|nr:hypothetical protein [Gemmataceae bacterium]
MNKYVRIGLGAAIGLALAIILLVTQPKSRSDAVTLDGTAVQGRLSSVGYLYALYRESRGRSPASLEELIEFGRKLPGPDGPIVFDQEYLTLSRDKQLMVIRFNLKLPAARARQASDGEGPIFSSIDGPILAHEQTGINGLRFVIFAGSNRVEEIDDAKFQQSMEP